MSRRRPIDPLDRSGAFLSDGRGMIPVPIRTLSDDYSDVPAEPPEDHEPEPQPPSLVHRVIERLTWRNETADS
jgi:hypothetical protein